MSSAQLYFALKQRRSLLAARRAINIKTGSRPKNTNNNSSSSSNNNDNNNNNNNNNNTKKKPNPCYDSVPHGGSNKHQTLHSRKLCLSVRLQLRFLFALLFSFSFSFRNEVGDGSGNVILKCDVPYFQ